MINGEERVRFLDEKGIYYSIPADWTDLSNKNPYECYGDDHSFFRIEDLIEVSKIVVKFKT